MDDARQTSITIDASVPRTVPPAAPPPPAGPVASVALLGFAYGRPDWMPERREPIPLDDVLWFGVDASARQADRPTSAPR